MRRVSRRDIGIFRDVSTNDRQIRRAICFAHLAFPQNSDAEVRASLVTLAEEAWRETLPPVIVAKQATKHPSTCPPCGE